MPTIYSHPARLAAIEAGQHRFDTGEPCKKGHFPAPRYISGACVHCAKLQTRANAKREQEKQRAYVASLLKRRKVA